LPIVQKIYSLGEMSSTQALMIAGVWSSPNIHSDVAEAKNQQLDLGTPQILQPFR